MKRGDGTYSLYRHTSPSGKVYIGITSQPVEYRWDNGRGYMHTKKTLFKSAIIKYGWDNIKHEVLFTGLSEERAKNLEIELIRHYKGLGISLNHTDGGEGRRGSVPWNKGIKVPYEKSNKRKGCHLTEEHKKKLSESHKGKSVIGHKWTESQRQKFTAARKGGHISEDIKVKISQNSAMSRKVLEYNSSGEIIAEFASASEAGRHYGISPNWVARACREKCLCKGHYFAYKDPSTDFSDIKYKRYKAGKAVTLKNVMTGEEKTFHSISLCSRFLGYKSVTSLKKAIDKKYIRNGWRTVYNGIY